MYLTFGSVFCRGVSDFLVYFPLFVLREDKENSGPSPPLQRKPIPSAWVLPARGPSSSKARSTGRVRGRRGRELVPRGWAPAWSISRSTAS